MAFQAKAGNRGFQPKSKPPVSRVVLIVCPNQFKGQNKKAGISLQLSLSSPLKLKYRTLGFYHARAIPLTQSRRHNLQQRHQVFQLIRSLL
ncbi:hypothetical protein IGI67_000687 [Enterococcus sp. AZ196]